MTAEHALADGAAARTPEIDRYAGVVFDLDGVIYLADSPVPGAAATVAAVREAGPGVAFVTNNASRTPEEIADKLCSMGVPATVDEIVTSSQATARLIEPGTRCLVVGADGLRTILERRGCVEVRDPDEAEAVVVGFTRDLVWDDLRRATLALRRGARYLATNGDVAFPSPEGLVPGNGAAVAAVSAASGRTPEIAGKPFPALFEAVAERLPAGRLLMIGDRPDTDIAGAAALGWDTALVLTGVTDADATADLDPAPTYIMDSVADLLG